MLTGKNAKASAVLAIVYDLIGEDTWHENRFSVEGYVNGREMGFSIAYFKPHVNTIRKVSFSECRNTDQIVIYSGDTINFSMQGNVPDDKTWKDAKYLGSDDYYPAALFIKKFLLGEE